MPSTTTALSISELLARFLAARRPALTARTARVYDDLSALLGEFLRDRRVSAVPCDPGFVVAPGASLGQLHREQRAAIDGLVELWDEAFLRTLVAAGIARDHQRIAEAMLRDLGRWLRTTRIAPPEAPRTASRRRAPHSAGGRPRVQTARHPVVAAEGRPAQGLPA